MHNLFSYGRHKNTYTIYITLTNTHTLFAQNGGCEFRSNMATKLHTRYLLAYL